MDVQEVADGTAVDRVHNKKRLDDERVIKALALVTMDEINILRGQHSLTDRTLAQLKTAVRGKL